MAIEGVDKDILSRPVEGKMWQRPPPMFWFEDLKKRDGMTVDEDVSDIRQKENEGSADHSSAKCANLINNNFFFLRRIYQKLNLPLFSLLIETATILWFLYFQFGYQLENNFCYRHFIWFYLKCNDPPLCFLAFAEFHLQSKK